MGTVRLRRRYLQALADILKDRPGIAMKDAKREAIRIARRTHGSVCKEHSAPRGGATRLIVGGLCPCCQRRRVQYREGGVTPGRCNRCIETGRRPASKVAS